MKTPSQKINIVIGQLQAINKMLDSKKDCQQVIIQLKAAKSAISSIMETIIENEFTQCLNKKKLKKAELKKIFSEVTKK